MFLSCIHVIKVSVESIYNSNCHRSSSLACNCVYLPRQLYSVSQKIPKVTLCTLKIKNNQVIKVP